MSDLLPNAEAAPEPATEAPAFATIVAQDGRLVRISPEGEGSLVITVAGTRQPLKLDAFQTLAFTAAVRSLASAA